MSSAATQGFMCNNPSGFRNDERKERVHAARLATFDVSDVSRPSPSLAAGMNDPGESSACARSESYAHAQNRRRVCEGEHVRSEAGVQGTSALPCVCRKSTAGMHAEACRGHPEPPARTRNGSTNAHLQLTAGTRAETPRGDAKLRDAGAQGTRALCARADGKHIVRQAGRRAETPTGDVEPRDAGAQGTSALDARVESTRIVDRAHVQPMHESLKLLDNRGMPGCRGFASALLRETASCLNNISPENIHLSRHKFCSMNVGSTADLIVVANFVVDKAVAEPLFASVYADLCVAGAAKFAEFLDTSTTSGKPITFKELLINWCKEVFESKSDVETEGLTAREAMRAVDKDKTRALGTIRFLGELYNKGLLPEQMMHACLRGFLLDVDTPEEQELECLCKLIMTVGKRVDH